MATRKIYIGHKIHGTCITFGATVFLAPAGAVFDKKSGPHKVDVTVSPDGNTAIDERGGVWTKKGWNPGCGVRCPVELRAVSVASFLAQHGDKLSETARQGLQHSVEVSPSGLMRTAWFYISNDDRKSCVAALAAPSTEAVRLAAPEPAQAPEPEAPAANPNALTPEELAELAALEEMTA